MAGMNFFDFHQQVAQRKRAAATPRALVEAGGAGPVASVSVSELTATIDRALKSGVPSGVVVRGEASNFKRHGASGHLYFTLKDSEACIDCVMFKSEAVRLKFQPGDGMELLATGRVGVFAKRGNYQLYVARLDPLGQGALELAFRQLKAKLEAEGLFDAEAKRPLPAYPRRIALVTSRETAALQDMLKVLRRFPWLHLLLFHVPVQGDGSAEKIASALHDINRNAEELGGVDAIVLARGGGSLEDLWEFNEEVVARAIAASDIPIVTGIGHEIDTSIADLVADHHAHTPTEAAQVVSANWRTAAEETEAIAIRLRREIFGRLEQARRGIANIERHEVFRRPLDRVNLLRQLLDHRQREISQTLGARLRKLQVFLHSQGKRLDEHRPGLTILRWRNRLDARSDMLRRLMSQRLRICQDRLANLVGGIRERHPRHAIGLALQRIGMTEAALHRIARELCLNRSQRVQTLNLQLEALNPQKVLLRGYSITTLKKTGAIMRSSEGVKAGDKLVTRFADGQVESVVENSRLMTVFD